MVAAPAVLSGKERAMKARLLLMILVLVFPSRVAHAGPFSYLDPGFVQELYAVNPTEITSFTFAPNGDLWAVQESPNALIRFDSHATHTVSGNQLHPIVQTVPITSSVGTVVGIALHPDGNLFLFADNGTLVADATTGAVIETSPGPLPCGGGQGTADPLSPNHLAVIGPGVLVDLDPNALTCSLNTWPVSFDHMYERDLVFDPSNHDLIAAIGIEIGDFPVETYSNWIDRFRTAQGGQMVGLAGLPGVPAGLTLLSGLRETVVAMEDGMIYRTDLEGADTNHLASLQLLASGGFPTINYSGNLVRKGPDGSLYVLQAGTRYNDSGNVTSEYSIVRIMEKSIATQVTTWGRVKAAYR
jgi:hypothetical protein